mmetsp:Transcript_3573/g.9536  ORF Transcript_3573/g.9536 Transcript_3573/m.9536 type:complete len:242 (-) Transcript_3573:1157-1882(-)
MHLDLLLPLLHGHLQLKLAILQAEHLVSLRIQLLTEPLHLQLKNIVTYHALLLLLDHPLQVTLRRVILHLYLCDHALELGRIGRALRRCTLGLLQIIGEALTLGGEHVELAVVLLELLLELSNLRVQLLLLLRGADTRSTRDLAFHELQLEIRSIHKLPLALRPLIKLLELRASVSRDALRARNIGEQHGLLLSQLKELLPLVEHPVFEHRQLLVSLLEPHNLLLIQLVHLLSGLLEVAHV